MTRTIQSLEDLLNDNLLPELYNEGIDFQITTLDGQKTLLLHANRPAQPSDNLTVNAECNGIRLSNVSALTQIVSGANFNIIPNEIPIADVLKFDDMKFVINQNSKKITALVIDIISSKSWEIIKDQFELERLTFSFTLIYPFSLPPQVFCSIFGTFNINGILLDAELSLPYFDISATIPDGESVSLSPLLDKVLPDAHLQSFEITDLRVDINPRQNDYGLQCMITEDWSILPSITLTELSMSIAKTGTAKPTGRIEANFNFANADLLVLADRSRTTSGWEFSGGTQSNQHIQVGALIGDLTSKFGVSAPSFVDNLALDNLLVLFDTDTKDFSFTSEWQSVGTLEFNLYSNPDQSPKTLIASYLNPA